jgi:predicted MFS family arabinose efflux permease
MSGSTAPLDPAPAEAAPPLLKNPAFLRLWSAQAVSLLGSGIGGEALPLAAILLLGAGPLQMGLLGALAAAPALLLSLPVGTWIDRTRRRPWMIAADLGRAGVVALLALAALSGRLRIEHLYLGVILTGALGLFYEVAYQSYVPGLVGRAQLLRANSRLAMSDSLAEVGGPAAGGALVQALGAPLTLLFDAASYLVSAVLLGSIRTPEPRPEQLPESASRQAVWPRVSRGLRVIWQQPALRPLAGSLVAFNFFGAFIGAAYGLYVISILGMSPVWLGLLVSAGGVGALLGAAVSTWVGSRLVPGSYLWAALAVFAGLALLIPLARGSGPGAVALLLASQVLGDLALAVYFIGEISLRQALTPSHLLGRVNASIRFLSAGALAAGMLTGGVLGQLIGVRPTLVLASLGILLGAAWLYFSPLRRLPHPPAPTPL